MEITLNMSPALLRKVKAFAVLTGEKAGSVEDSLIRLVDKAVTESIISHAKDDSDSTPVSRLIQRTAMPKPKKRVSYEYDASTVSDGLGDEEPKTDDLETTDENAFVDSKAGLTDKDVSGDMDVADPEHEAKAEASTFMDDMQTERAEDLFSSVAGLPTLPPEEESRKVRGKKRPPKIKGKVSEFMGGNTERA